VGTRSRCRTAVAVLVALLVLAVSGCRSGAARTGAPAPARAVVSATTSTTAARPATTTAPRLVAWHGPVEHLFFHTLVIRPELAFTDDELGQGFRDWYVTVGEFRRILEQMDANGWTLVDIHRAVAGTVRVPAGRKPFVLSEDDVDYYDDTRPRGVGWKLALDGRGDVKVEEHVDGRVLAVTGYEGVLGERLTDLSSVARARALVARLKATGWTFASHSYGHIDESTHSVARLVHDSEEWNTQDEPIVGPTDVYVYPFGAGFPVDSPKVAVLRSFGFTILCDIDIVPRFTRGNGVTIMTRRHVDGVAFDDAPARLAPFFDVATVEDHAARGSR
jgi:hypothetical protein